MLALIFSILQMISYYKVLGIEKDASQEEIEKTFARLRRSLAKCDFQDSGRSREQARKCLDSFERAYQVLSSDEDRKKHDQELNSNSSTTSGSHKKPRIGQICVASGIISVEQLEEAVKDQMESGLALGEIFENKHYISRAELEGLLMGQNLIDLPSDRADPTGKRLIALDLITEDMLLIAQMETKALGVSLEHALVRRGWVAESLMKILKI